MTLEASGLLPQHAMGKQGEFSITAGKGSLADDGWNVYGTIGFQKTQQVMTTDRGFAMSSLPVNGTSNSTSPANYLYNGTLYNSSAPGCVGGTGLIPNVNNPGACREQTSLFTQIQPEVKQWTWTAKGTKQFGDDTSASLQYVGTRTTTDTLVAPTPLAGALTMSGTNPNYPAVSMVPPSTSTVVRYRWAIAAMSMFPPPNVCWLRSTVRLMAGTTVAAFRTRRTK